MERSVCPSCKVVNVPAGHTCFDCAYQTPQDRQNAYETGETMLRASLMSLRDRFAMAALSTTSADEAPSKFFTNMAYEWADLMLESRQLPESG